MSRRAPHRKRTSLFRAKKRDNAIPGARRQVQACARVDRRRECRWSRRASARHYADKDRLSSVRPGAPAFARFASVGRFESAETQSAKAESGDPENEMTLAMRSEERRVGKECRSGW